MPIMAASANALKTQAVWKPVKCKNVPRYNPSNGSQAPQITYSRNIMIDNLLRMDLFMVGKGLELRFGWCGNDVRDGGGDFQGKNRAGRWRNGARLCAKRQPQRV